MSTFKSLTAVAVALAVVAGSASTAEAGRRHGGAAAAALIGGIIVGGAIAASASRAHADDEDEAYARCEEDFRSFDPRTGTIVNRYGEERLCPYLR